MDYGTAVAVDVEGEKIRAKYEEWMAKKEGQYKTLNDAAENKDAEIATLKDLSGLAVGDVEVWYYKSLMTADCPSRDYGLGYEFCLKRGTVPDVNNLEATHAKIGSVVAKDFNYIYDVLQGMYWSPYGEAKNVILDAGAKHTSMSMGDVIKVGDDVYMVDEVGFRNLRTGEVA